MIRRSPVEDVIGAVVTALNNSTGVTGIASGGVYNNVPQGTAFPYVEVTSPADRRVDTMARFGSELLVNVKVASQHRGDQQAAEILGACVQALNFATLSLASHSSLGITWDNSDRYAEIVNGVTTRYHVGIFRVWTEQTS